MDPANASLTLSTAKTGRFEQSALTELWESYRPNSTAPEDLLDERYVLAHEPPYRVFFAPIGAIPHPSARIIFVGLTPGLTQVKLCAELYLNASDSVRRDARAFSRLLTSNVSFAGSMRSNLCCMLDDLNLPQMLGNVRSSLELFQSDDDSIATTSALVYPVFTGERLKNFSGTTDLSKSALFGEMIDSLLAPRLAVAEQALVVPLGESAASAIRRLVIRGEISTDRVLFGLPHPSGANGHRAKHFAERKAELAERLQRWSKIAG